MAPLRRAAARVRVGLSPLGLVQRCPIACATALPVFSLNSVTGVPAAPVRRSASPIRRTSSNAVWPFITAHPTATPRIRPITAVTAIARAPPSVTRTAARPIGAPPR